MSRPAAPESSPNGGFAPVEIEVPESETPETNALARLDPLNVRPQLIDLARSLERRLSLAQTEIKGHMRVEDELREEIVKLSAKRSEEILERGSLHMTQMREHLAQAQARIAELEKDAGRYRWLRQSDCRDGVPFVAIFDGRLTQWTGKFADEQVDSAIDAALKSRA